MADVLKPQIYDTSGNPVDLPEDKIPEAISSGKYSFLKGAQIPVINSDGDTGTVPAESAIEAFKNGFSYEPSQAQLDRVKAKENSGPLKATEATLAGAARGVTLGVSDPAMIQMGVKKQSLSDLEKYRPGWSMAGEAGGILGQTLLMPEIGPAGAISKIGRGVTAGAEALGEGTLSGIEAGSRAAKVLNAAKEIGAHAAGSAVEGAIYSGVGNSISEAALGDPDLNGEKVLSNFGYGALLGGALGGALKGASIAIPEGLSLAKDGMVKLKNTLIGTGENDSGLIGKALPEKISDALANRSINLDTNEKIKLIDDTTSDLNEVHKNIETTVKKLNSEIRPQETEALIDTANPTQVRYARQDVVNAMNDAVALMRKEPELYSANAARKLEIQRDGIVNGMKEDDTPSAIFKSMREVKQELQGLVFSKIPTSQEAESINLINGVSKKINGILKDPEVFGFAGSSLAAHDEMLSGYYKYISPNARKPTEFQKAFMAKTGQGPNTRWEFDPKKVERVLKTQETITGQQKVNLLNGYYDTLKTLPEHLENTYSNVPNENFDSEKLSKIIDNSQKSNTESAAKYLEAIHNSKKSLGMGDYLAAHIAMTHPIVGAAMEVYNIASKPIEHLNKLAEIERLVGKATNAVGRGAAAIFKPAIALGDVSRNAITKIALEDRIKNHKDLADKLAQFNNNPSSLTDTVASNTEALNGVAPNTSGAIQQATIRATQFLASKIPIPTETNQFSEPYEPSKSEMATFERYLNIADKPTLALEQVREGTLTPETIETLTAIYPKLYDHMKQAVVEEATKMINKKKPIPYSVKQSVSHFIGVPMDSTMTPQSIMANQATYAQNAQENAQNAAPQKTKASVVGMRKIDLSSRTSDGRNDEV